MDNHSIKILILDDEPFMLKVLMRMLNNLGYNTVSAHDNGYKALQFISTPDQPTDLILLDINMPEMDGLEFIRHLVERQYTGSLILISGEDELMRLSAEKLAKSHKISVLGQLQKPPTPESLLSLIKTLPPQTQGYSDSSKKKYGANTLRSAIEKGELVNYYQPKVLTATGHVIGVEALVRWIHPQDGIVLPEQFIGLAEKSGLIDELAQVVIRNAFAQARVWQRSGLHMSVNLSMHNLASLNFVDMLTQLATKECLTEKTVHLEVKETPFTEDMRTPLEIFSKLRLKRFLISIDDFGTGKTSLAQLRDLPFDELKIDKGFVHGACHDQKLRAMFDSCLNLANQLNMSVVAEGVEDRADWDFVCQRGCQVAQGFYIAKPMPATEFPAWLKSWNQAYPNLDQHL